MFEVGFFELVIIFGVALVVLGPTRLPALVSRIGRWVGKARRMARDFREQLENEVNLEELNRTDSKPKPPVYPAPPPEFSGEPAPAAPVTPDAPEPEYPVPPPGDPSHGDLSEPQSSLDFNATEKPDSTHDRSV